MTEEREDEDICREDLRAEMARWAREEEYRERQRQIRNEEREEDRWVRR